MWRYLLGLALIVGFFLGVAYWLSLRLSVDHEFGSFDGTPSVTFVESGNNKGREMRLLKDFSYTDPSGTVWTAKEGYETDGASIPKVFWSFVGGPFEGSYRNAAIIHDWYFDKKDKPWQDVNRIFFYGCRAAGVDALTAKVLYAAVMLGSQRWGRERSGCFAGCHAAPALPMNDNGDVLFTPVVTEADAKSLVDSPTLEEIVKRTQTHASSIIEER